MKRSYAMLLVGVTIVALAIAAIALNLNADDKAETVNYSDGTWETYGITYTYPENWVSNDDSEDVLFFDNIENESGELIEGEVILLFYSPQFLTQIYPNQTFASTEEIITARHTQNAEREAVVTAIEPIQLGEYAALTYRYAYPDEEGQVFSIEHNGDIFLIISRAHTGDYDQYQDQIKRIVQSLAPAN